jgi:hypothetical protein
MPEFKTKDEVDAWYDAAMDGVGRAGAVHVTRRTGATGDYLFATKALAGIRDDMYRQLGIPVGSEPPEISFKDAVRRHCSW